MSMVNEFAHEPVYELTNRVGGCSGSAYLTYKHQNDV